MNKNWFIGIDVSKKTLDASIFVADVVINKFPHMQVRNDKEGFKELLKWLKEQGVRPQDALIGLEFTGYYSDALELFLTRKKLSYTMLPTTVVKHYQRGTRDKNDKTDSAKIADYLFRFHDTECIKLRVLPSKPMQVLKALKSERKFYVRHRTDCENRQRRAISELQEKHASELQSLQSKLDAQNELLKRLAAEYTIMGRECEHEHMTDAAIRNYEKALELYPDAGDARRRLKKLQK